jgi:hypothetical protein
MHEPARLVQPVRLMPYTISLRQGTNEMPAKDKEQADGQEATPPHEKQPLCFVIGPIGSEGSDIRKHADMFLEGVVKVAVENLGYHVERSDEVAEPGMINDRVIHAVIHAELAIADLTFNNPNAFYELGIRHAALKPVIHFAQKGTELPFDSMGYRTIIEDITGWNGIVGARERIQQALKAVRKPGYQVSNPITQANASFKMKESFDSKDQLLVALMARLDAIDRKQMVIDDQRLQLRRVESILENALYKPGVDDVVKMLNTNLPHKKAASEGKN